VQFRSGDEIVLEQFHERPRFGVRQLEKQTACHDQRRFIVASQWCGSQRAIDVVLSRGQTVGNKNDTSLAYRRFE
jgi:hypothetical protein